MYLHPGVGFLNIEPTDAAIMGNEELLIGTGQMAFKSGRFGSFGDIVR